MVAGQLTLDNYINDENLYSVLHIMDLVLCASRIRVSYNQNALYITVTKIIRFCGKMHSAVYHLQGLL